MKLFDRKPVTERQRARWLLLIQLVEQQTLTSLEEISNALEQHGQGANISSIQNDLKACNIHKVGGEYRILPHAVQEEVEEIIRYRMRVSVHNMFHTSNMVILNCQRGAGPWLGSSMRELEDDDIISVMQSDDAVWLLTSSDRGESLYTRLHTLFMESRS